MPFSARVLKKNFEATCSGVKERLVNERYAVRGKVRGSTPARVEEKTKKNAKGAWVYR